MEISFFIRTAKEYGNIRIRLSDGRMMPPIYAVTDILVKKDWWDNKKEKLNANTPAEFRSTTDLKLSTLERKITDAYINDKPEGLISSEWLKHIVNGDTSNKAVSRTFFDYWDECIAEAVSGSVRRNTISHGTEKAYSTLRGKLERFEKVKGKPIPIIVTEKLLYQIEDFIINEVDYVKLHPAIYKPYYADRKNRTIERRGSNYAVACMSKMRKVVTWMHDKRYIKDNPFGRAGYEIKDELYADPIALSIEELEYIRTADVPPSLTVVRDMFVLQCYIGCRVGDYVQLKRIQLDDDVLIYTPDKGSRKNAETLHIPLNRHALEIVHRYDSQDRLFPFINVNGADGYNKNIKVLFHHLKIDRVVAVLNTVTRKMEYKPIYEVATSHLARKTFATAVFNATGDKKSASSLTGHSENSQAYDRYAKAQLPLKKNIIKNVFDQ